MSFAKLVLANLISGLLVAATIWAIIFFNVVPALRQINRDVAALKASVDSLKVHFDEPVEE